MRFRPSILVTVLIAVCVLIQLRLAWWQWGRHLEQAAELDDVTARMRNAPASNAELGDPVDALSWRKAHLDGRFTGERFFLTNRVEFGEPGLDLVEVLEVGGRSLLVNRGWIALRTFEADLATVASGPARVEGLLLPADDSMLPSGCYRPADTPLAAVDTLPDRWVGANWPGIRASTTTPLLDVVVIAGPELSSPRDKERAVPTVGWIARPKQIGHLTYAGQWFLIACVFTGGWVYASFRRGQATA